MPFRVSGKNIDIGQALRNRMSSRVAEAVDKYFHGGYSGHATVGKEAFGFHTECVLHLDSGIVLQADAMAGDAYSSVDQTAERIERRLRRYKHRLRDHRTSRYRRRDGNVGDPVIGHAPKMTEVDHQVVQPRRQVEACGTFQKMELVTGRDQDRRFARKERQAENNL